VGQHTGGFDDGRPGTICAAGFALERLPKRMADDFVSEMHYSGSAVWASHTHIGVRDADGKLWGVLQFGPSMNPKATAKVIEGLPPRELVELNRMVFVDGHPANLPSWAIAKSAALIRSERPYVQVIQSFADQRCKKLGAVYQASNFIYLGSHSTEFYFLDGEWFHRSLLGRAAKDNRGWGSGPKAARLAAGRDRAQRFEFDQFRYVLPLTKWARRRLLPRAMPYPKGSSVAVEFPTANKPPKRKNAQLGLFGKCG
jgi:hypothetical protein